MAPAQRLSIDGQQVRVTNLDKVLYPATGTTKGDVIDYYRQIAHVMLPHCVGRPATRKRWVHGVGTAQEPGEVFFQKNLDAATPEWVSRSAIQHKDHAVTYPLVNDTATLVWLAQMAALEIHVPQWRVDANPAAQVDRRHPDRLVLDLDPGPGAGLPECVEVAKLCRVILQGMGLRVVPVTSGSKGIHLYAALDGSQTSAQISAVAHELARALEADHGDLVVSDMKKSLRTGKVLLDWSQNSAAKTTIAPYSLRGRERPTVAAPRTWRELGSPALKHLDFREVLQRVADRGDPLAAVAGAPEPRSNPSVSSRASGDASSGALAIYRAKRNPDRTPEPFHNSVAGGVAGPGAESGPVFVIQEHHARRLHYDFRLEHDGVLASWALPKGIPPDGVRNHLAVQTEDHPLSYAGFEGTIPRGEYGAGTVRIWDCGTYTIEKWRPGQEIIVTLHGQSGGGLGGSDPVRVALIRTHSQHDSAAGQWLVHRMQLNRAESAVGMESATPKRHPRAIATTTQVQSPTSAREPASRQSSIPVAPMLATAAGSRQPEGTGWSCEMKWDGMRAIISVRPDAPGDEFRIWTRNGHDVTADYPELRVLVEQVQVPVILDGEIVALQQGRPDFGRLQERFGLSRPRDVARAQKEVPVDLMLFDVLEADGRDLTSQPYEVRREALQLVVDPQGRIHIPAVFDGDLPAALQASLDLGLEGIVVKDQDAPYEAGRRSAAWLKIKHSQHQEVVVIGWRPGRGSRSQGVGSLLVAVPNAAGTLQYVGRVGSGLTERALAQLETLLESASRPVAPATPQAENVPVADARDAVWVWPHLIGEVEFAQWTDSGKLRHPVWRGLRPDRSIEGLRG